MVRDLFFKIERFEMKNSFTALRVFLCVCCLGVVSVAQAADVWSTLSQANRNSRIVAQAQSAVSPSQLAGQCKSFAVDVVRVASNQANGYTNTRILPLTADWSYYGDMSSYVWSQSDPNYQYVTATPGNGTSPLFGVVQGSIIQMRIKLAGGGYTPHTTIVEVNNTSTQVLTLIESNYYGDSHVYRRWINYPDFVSALEANYEYTIYQIK
jgi:hypothetical protein